MIGQLGDEAQAKLFSEFLYAQGIDNQIESEREGSWALWVHSEDHIDPARKHLSAFQEHPKDPKYEVGARVARLRHEDEKRAEEEARRKHFDRDRILRAGMTRMGYLTALLIVASVGVAIFSQLGENMSVLRPLSITDYRVDGGFVESRGVLNELGRGQIWRLVTPIFIHFGPLHLLFNMLWLFDLGTMVERRQNLWVLLGLVVAIAIPSNLAQFLVSGPTFGGMSGVVYGLIGYIWIRGKFDPASGLFLHSSTVTMAAVWYFLCLLGVIPGVANTVHTVGLVIGLGWGFVSSQWATRQGRQLW